MMKKIFLLFSLLMLAFSVNAQGYETYDEEEEVDTIYKVRTINEDQFKALIADWSAVDWVMKTDRPVVVEFYADWCQPCRQLEPRLRQIAQIYKGEVLFYRINVDENSKIAETFQIRNIPYLLICPLEGEPKSVCGLYPMMEYIRVINLALGR